MLRLMEILLHTPDVPRMRSFYEKVIGLATRTASPAWTAYETAGALLALRPAGDAQPPSIELTFETANLEDTLQTLKGHGVTPSGKIETHSWGRLARLRDPDGNAIAIAQPTHPVELGEGPAIGVAIAHTQDLAAMKAFYHHALGLHLSQSFPGWVEFDSGATRLALRDTEPPHGGSMAFGFRMEDLMEWAEGARERGLHFTTVPGAEDWGLFSDTLDPDGNRLTFFEPADPPALEEELAEDFDDETPHQVALRKPVVKNSRSASRLVVKPEYKPKAAGAKPKRARPAVVEQAEKAQAKPATGRLKKAVTKVMARKKVAVAKAGKTKPVKRAASASRGKASKKGRTKPTARAKTSSRGSRTKPPARGTASPRRTRAKSSTRGRKR